MRARVAAALVVLALALAPVMVLGQPTKPARPGRAPARAAAVETEAAPAAVPPAPTASSPAPAAAPGSPASAPAPSFMSAGGTLLLGSLVLVGLLYGAARLMRRMPFARFLPSADGPIRIAARTHLGARESLCLVDVGPTTLLVAVTAQSIQALHVWPDGVRTAPPPGQFAGSGLRPSVPGQLRGLAARLSGGR
jgi:flagellar biogenesis protein FliO